MQGGTELQTQLGRLQRLLAVAARVQARQQLFDVAAAKREELRSYEALADELHAMCIQVDRTHARTSSSAAARFVLRLRLPSPRAGVRPSRC